MKKNFGLWLVILFFLVVFYFFLNIATECNIGSVFGGNNFLRQCVYLQFPYYFTPLAEAFFTVMIFAVLIRNRKF